MAIFSGTMMDDILVGTMEDDVLWGGMGDDDISGGGGDDRLIGGPGADVLDGGPGRDIASYIGSRSGVHVDLGAAFYDPGAVNAPVRGGDAMGDQLNSIEELWGSNRGDVLMGNHTANRLFGNGGNDQVYGGGGNDFLRGGMGDDNIFGGGGKDALFGDMGVDELMGDGGDDILFGGMDDDVLMGGAGDDVLEGGPGADMHYGDGRMDPETGEYLMDTGSDTAAYTTSSEAVTVNLGGAGTEDDPIAMGGDATGDMFMGIENLRGSMYDDMLVGDNPHEDYMAMDNMATMDVDESMLYSGANKIYGNMGADKIKGMGGADMLYGGKGDDVLYGGDGMGGDDGDDMLYGQLGDDLLKGGLGNDTLAGGAGADKLFGGWVEFPDGPDGDPAPMADEMGMDTADYSKSPEGVHVDLLPADLDENRQTPNTIRMGMGGDAEGDTYHDIQNLTGSAFTDMLRGDDADNLLMGMDGDDWNDPETTDVVEGGLFGGNGEDTLMGGDGNDWLDASGRAEVASTRANSNTDGDEQNIANLIEGGAGDDMLIGGLGNDRDEVDENADNAVVTRGGLFGGPGNDTLDGGAGADFLFGGPGNDVIIYDSGDTIDNTPGGVRTTDVQAGKVDGGEGVDTLDASADEDGVTIVLDASADAFANFENAIGSKEVGSVLVGDSGDNILTGGDSDDTIRGGEGDDWLIGGDGDDGTQDDGTENTDNDAMRGDAGNDTIDGGDGDDYLSGGDGADLLIGGEGDDTLQGGSGADTFAFGKQADDDSDTVTDFSALQGDMIDLTALNLSSADLDNVLGTADPATDRTSVTLDLTSYDGGTIVISLSGGLGTLGADDFIV